MAGEDAWTGARGVHTQRHWPVATLAALAEEGGLRIHKILGQRAGARLEPWVEEPAHDKALFVATRA